MGVILEQELTQSQQIDNISGIMTAQTLGTLSCSFCIATWTYYIGLPFANQAKQVVV